MLRRSLFVLVAAVGLSSSWANGADLLGLTPVGAVAGYSRSADGITVKCSDQSEVRLQVMAPDLIRVRAAFMKALPERDHSWAIADATWTTPQ
jgi:hypothetical protein